MRSVSITLAGAPMAKERVRVTREGHAFTPERTVTFEGRLAHAASLVMGERPLFEGAIAVDMALFLPIPKSKSRRWRENALAGQIRPVKKPDWDNYAKILDALNLIVWVDDSQVVEGRVRKFYSARPRTEIEVRTLHQEVTDHERHRQHDRPTSGVFA